MAISSVLSVGSVFLAAAAQVASQQTLWGQCGGIGYSGSTSCVSGAHCTTLNDYYAQCVPGAATSSSSPSTTAAPPPTTIVTTTSDKPSTTTSKPTGGSTPPAGTTAEDFENGWDQSAWPTYAPSCNQGGTVALDSTKAHSGSKSMKVTGGSSGYCGHIFFGTNKVPSGGDVYVRTWLMTSTALGSNHVTFMVMPDTSQGSGKHLRIGGQSSILMYNRESDDATLPDLSPQGIASSTALTANKWQCFEYHVSSDGTIETWLDGTAIKGLTVGPGITNPNANGWGSSYKPAITGVYFGWESYSGAANTFWYDDIAIGSSRIGC